MRFVWLIVRSGEKKERERERERERKTVFKLIYDGLEIQI